MRKIILALSALLFAGTAHAAPAAQSYTTAQPSTVIGNPQVYSASPVPFSSSAIPVTATGGTTQISLADRARTVLSPLDFGAKCDGTTDDSAAWNAMISYVQGLSVPSNSQRSFAVRGCQGTMKVTSPINMTGFTNTTAIQFDLQGMTILCSMNGGVCVDALSSRWLEVDHLSIKGDCTGGLVPTVGFQWGRNNNNNADLELFENPTVQGCFTETAALDVASETTIVNHPFFNNSYATGSASYALIADGYNHFNVTSTFVTVTIAVDTVQSFNEAMFISGWYGVSTPNAAIWIGNAGRIKFDRSYCEGGSYCAALYTGTTGGITTPWLDLHSETLTSLFNVFLFTGPKVNPKIYDMTYIEHSTQAQTSIFKADTGVTSVALPGLEMQMGGTQSSSTVQVFDQPSLYNVSGDIKLASATNWTAPATFSGTLCFLDTTLCYDSKTPREVVNRNPDFDVDQFLEGATLLLNTNGGIIVDGWHESNAGGVLNTLTWQTSVNSIKAGYIKSLSATVTNPFTPTAAQQYHIHTVLEGADIANLGWGTAAAQPVVVDYCLRSTINNHVVSFYVQDQGADRSYVINHTLTTAGTTYCFSDYIPGDTTAGTWASGRNNIGAFMGFGIAPGANFQTTAGAWQSGNYTGTSANTNWTATGGAVLRLTAFHVFASPIDSAYKKRNTAQELGIERHWARKSFLQGVKAAQGTQAGSALGAVMMIAPFAQTLSATIGAWVGFDVPMFNNNGYTGGNILTPVFYNPVSANAKCYDITQAADAGSVTALNFGDTGFFLECGLVAGDMLGDVVEVQYWVDSGF